MINLNALTTNNIIGLIANQAINHTHLVNTPVNMMLIIINMIKNYQVVIVKIIKTIHQEVIMMENQNQGQDPDLDPDRGIMQEKSNHTLKIEEIHTRTADIHHKEISLKEMFQIHHILSKKRLIN